MSLLDNLPGALRLLRLEAGLSQRAAAAQIREKTGSGVTQAMISQWERGEQRPSLDSLEAVLDGFGRSLAELHSALDGIEPRRASRNDPVDEFLALADRREDSDPQLRERLRALLDMVDIAHLPEKLEEVTSEISRLESFMRSEIENLERQLRDLKSKPD